MAAFTFDKEGKVLMSCQVASTLHPEMRCLVLGTDSACRSRRTDTWGLLPARTGSRCGPLCPCKKAMQEIWC